MRWPRKLKRHIANYLRFVGVFFVAETIIEAWQQNVGFEHYGLVVSGAAALFFAVSAWFIRRGYIGLYRDCDFFIED